MSWRSLQLDKLKAENVKLREQLDVAEHNQTRNAREYARMCHENDKLRELVGDMFACIRYANEQDWFYFDRDKPGCGMSCVVNGEGCGLSVLADRMRELGIEVEP